MSSITSPNSNDTLVSVVVPLYNGERFIESTLMSILAQTYPNREILVVNDASEDRGPSLVSSLSKKHPGTIRFFEHPDRKNHGIAASRNLAIRNAHGAYVAFVDQDDMWLPSKLERQVNALKLHPSAGFVYSMASFVDQEGSDELVDGEYGIHGKGIPTAPQNIFMRLIQENIIPTLTVVARKTCLERVGLFDEGPRYEYEDWLLFSKLALLYDAMFIPEVLAKYRHHSNNYSGYLFNTHQLYDAEEHYTITLFSFLKNQGIVSPAKFRTMLHRRIWYFFLRARSWNVPIEEMHRHANHLAQAFPSEMRTIQLAKWTMTLFPAEIAVRLRRIRRSVVGL